MQTDRRERAKCNLSHVTRWKSPRRNDSARDGSRSNYLIHLRLHCAPNNCQSDNWHPSVWRGSGARRLCGIESNYRQTVVVHHRRLKIRIERRPAPNRINDERSIASEAVLRARLSCVSSASGVSLSARRLIESSNSLNRELDEHQLPILLFFGRRVTQSVISAARSEPQMSMNLSQSRRRPPGMSKSDKGIAFFKGKTRTLRRSSPLNRKRQNKSLSEPKLILNF